jgi:hypothetical protein
MPKIRPTPPKDRQDYRRQLPGVRRSTFDQLANLIDAPRQDLGWYHQLGTLVRQMFPEGTRHGQKDLAKLAEALGPCSSMLQKAARFVELYQEEGEADRLRRMGVEWTRLWIAFPIRNQQAREKLLRRAIEEKWTILKLRVKVQQRISSKRRGAGGPRRRLPEPYGPEVTLRELEHLSRKWLDFHESAWEKIGAADWQKLVRDWPAANRGKLLPPGGNGRRRRKVRVCLWPDPQDVGRPAPAGGRGKGQPGT